MTKPPKDDEEREMNWLAMAFGLLVIYFGIHLIDDPILTTVYGYRIDMSSVKYPFAVTSTIFGCYFIWLGFMGTPVKGTGKGEDNDILMCSTCDKDFLRKNTKDNKCPLCSTELELLEGFYWRHPELKDKAEPFAHEETTRCVPCDKFFAPHELHDGLCPLCGTKTKPLRDFHERYPHMKDEN